MTYLLDGNVLIALKIEDHVFHHRSAEWFASARDRKHRFATCPTTEGTLLRLHMRFHSDPGASAAWAALKEFHAMPDHECWLDNFSYGELSYRHLQGHRQLTDAWLVELVRRKRGKIATLDAALATLYPDAVELIPVLV